MNKQQLRIVFMGTPDFAVESLRALVEGGYNVVAVITMPDKPIGRHGNHLQASPVKQFAVESNIPVLQPEKLKNPEFLQQLQDLKADLQIVVAFRMLPEAVWAMPPLGTFNLHASLLPQYRGAAPINWAVINGETETGITTFFLQHDIDTGKIIQQVHVPILASDNAGDVHDRLMQLGATLVTETVDNILAGTIAPIDQALLTPAGTDLKPAPKIFRETCQILWNQPAKRVYDFIRGLSPHPGAWTTLCENNGSDATTVKIFEAKLTSEPIPQGEELAPGSIITDAGQLFVACTDGLLAIQQLQLAGKKRMPAADFLRGKTLDANAQFVYQAPENGEKC